MLMRFGAALCGAGMLVAFLPAAHAQTGIASIYAYKGEKTADGERASPGGFTAAHRTLPFGTHVRVTNERNGRSVVVRINDRGPFHAGRIIDLSYAAAYRLGIVQVGSGEVEVEAVVPGQPEAVEPAAVAAATDIAPATDTVAPADVSPARGIFLQVGAFTSRENAESLRARLASLEEPGELLLTGTLWRLQLGPYRTQDDARSAAERLERTFDLKPLFVVR